ncbi:MAG: cation transporter [Bdellovibrio sp. CG10_big_fil_rev_8_21_14_0_10_47_8]|nr:MAG: cation transporter [Bdellovibrio sp. CG10_big_fil_rev_8_21_14_0_10_47_8]
MSEAKPHHDGHSHSHSHNHGHSHAHAHTHSATGNLSVAFFMNLAFAAIELVGGLWTNSLAILSDAFHDLGDAAAIGMAWYLERKSQQGVSRRFSYGYRRLSVLAALITGIILMMGSGLVVVKAVPRLLNPETPNVPGMIALALLGLVVNGVAAYRMSKGASLNEKMILWHLLEDVMGWVAILIGSLVMMVYPLPILDPIMAIGVAVWVLWNVFRNLKETLKVFLQATPDDVDMATIEETLRGFESVQDVHHMHLWSMDGLHHILTTHLTVRQSVTIEAAHQLKSEIKKSLMELYHIAEATIEIEWPNQVCADPKH